MNASGRCPRVTQWVCDFAPYGQMDYPCSDSICIRVCVCRKHAECAGAPTEGQTGTRGWRVRGPSYFSASAPELFFLRIYRHVRNTQPRLQYPRIDDSHLYLAISHVVKSKLLSHS